MSASVVNQAYSQQVNQAFDLFKTFTPQQMQQMGQQVAQKPNSPEAVAFASAAQYQQQMRAPQPQAPQGTIFQQKLQEFQQTSPQGLPSVGGNQMAMQQAAQQDPMRNAGIGAAPENMPAPQPQGQAATGGLVALAHGGEVRHFDGTDGSNTADPLAGLKNLNVDPNDPNLESQFNLQSAVGDTAVANEALGGNPNTSSLQYGDNKYAKDRAAATHKNLLSEAKTKKQAPSEKGIGSLPVAKDQTSMAGLEKYLTPKGSVDPSFYDKADAIVANMLNKDTTPKYSEEPIGKHDILFAPADTSSAARNEASPTAKGESYSSKQTDAAIAEIARLRGPEADMSEEVAMAKEAARGANKDKWGTALAQGIGGMLSAQTPYMGQALGAGLMAGASGYSQGAKEEQAANKDLMALNMASKKAKLAGHREATDIHIAQVAKQREAEAAARVKAADLLEVRKTALMTGKQSGEYGLSKERMGNEANLELEGFKQGNRMEQAAYEAQLKQIAAEADPKTRQALVTSLVAAGSKGGLTLDDVYSDLDRWMNFVNQGSQAAPQSTGFGQPLKGGMYLK